MPKKPGLIIDVLAGPPGDDDDEAPPPDDEEPMPEEEPPPRGDPEAIIRDIEAQLAQLRSALAEF